MQPETHQPEALLSQLGVHPDYPINDWHPNLCGKIDILIKKDGSWWHEGRRMARASMVDLFAKLLRKDEEGFVLVTPHEKLLISVEDLPLVITDIEDNHAPKVKTGQGDWILLGSAHPIIFDGDADMPLPRVRIRDDLWARFSRSAYYSLMDMVHIETHVWGLRLRLADQMFDLKTPAA
jgi:uncharacterized protein